MLGWLLLLVNSCFGVFIYFNVALVFRVFAILLLGLDLVAVCVRCTGFWLVLSLVGFLDLRVSYVCGLLGFSFRVLIWWL